MKYLSCLFIVVAIALVFSLTRCTNNDSVQENGSKSPEEELAGFKVPEGFVIELVASERDGIINPVRLTFDDRGRLWTKPARRYTLDSVAEIQRTVFLKCFNDSA